MRASLDRSSRHRLKAVGSLRLVFCIFAWLGGPGLSFAQTTVQSISVVMQPGWNLIANPLNATNGNALDNILRTNVSPALPDGCQFFKYLNDVTNGSPW